MYYSVVLEGEVEVSGFKDSIDGEPVGVEDLENVAIPAEVVVTGK